MRAECFQSRCLIDLGLRSPRHLSVSQSVRSSLSILLPFSPPLSCVSGRLNLPSWLHNYPLPYSPGVITFATGSHFLGEKVHRSPRHSISQTAACLWSDKTTVLLTENCKKITETEIFAHWRTRMTRNRQEQLLCKDSLMWDLLLRLLLCKKNVFCCFLSDADAWSDCVREGSPYHYTSLVRHSLWAAVHGG